MGNKLILGKTIEQWKREFPLLKDLINTNEVMWINGEYKKLEEVIKNITVKAEDINEAEERLIRFSNYIKKVFPETEVMNGIIESQIISINEMKNQLNLLYQEKVTGNLLLKCDSHLPISGSIKARGGIYEVLKHAEDLAIKAGILSISDDYEIFASDKFREFFSNYSIAVGSTGNLGLSIGIISAKLGFKVSVHMSSDAKQWKKELLRSKGVTVLEYESDYSKAVEEGRKQSKQQKNSYFVDDENSKNLFMGYAVAASRVKKQLETLKVLVDDEHPLFVYLPCGVGGGPGGVALGLKLIYKDNVHCFFAEPTHSPCMLMGSMTKEHEKICVQDFGIDNITAADGLAVGRPSGFVGRTLENLLSGIYTIEDDNLYLLLSLLADSEDIYLEPSALAGMAGPVTLLNTEAGREYIEKNQLTNKLDNGTHIVWATGGSMVPTEEMEKYYKKGKGLIRKV